MKLKDVQPGQFFAVHGTKKYLKIYTHEKGSYVFDGDVFKNVAVDLRTFRITSFKMDDDLEVTVVNPEDL